VDGGNWGVGGSDLGLLGWGAVKGVLEDSWELTLALARGIKLSSLVGPLRNG
jgi:hypothetical protein